MACTGSSRPSASALLCVVVSCLLLITTDARVAHGTAFGAGRRAILENDKDAAKPKASSDSAPAVNASSTGSCPDVQEVINATNTLRALHQAPALAWDNDLAAASQAYAEQLAARDCSLSFSGNGENLFGKTTYPKPSPACAEAVSAWYRESELYDFDTVKPYNDNSDKEIWHFTQLVWKKTTKFGCGSAVVDKDYVSIVTGKVRPGGCKVVVCRYQSPGNVPGNREFRKNVLPPKP